MKRFLLACAVLALVLTACSTDSINTPEEEITVNLETFIPDSKFDETPRGKYVGIFGHHSNREMHGKISINAGQHDQFDALVRLVDGSAIKFSVDHSIDVDVSNLLFKGETGSFLADFSDYENPIITNVTIKGESTPGYIIAKKAIRGGIPYVMVGTYADSSAPGFTGNWDIMTDGIPIPITTDFGPTVYQNISLLSVSHTGVPTPFTDNMFEPTPPLPCLSIVTGATPPPFPFVIEIPIFGGQAIAGALQNSSLNGFDSIWSLAYVQPNPFFPTGVYYDTFCNEVTTGEWTWNGRTGTSTVTFM